MVMCKFDLLYQQGSYKFNKFLVLKKINFLELFCSSFFVFTKFMEIVYLIKFNS